jgi:hypothetical protein
MIRYLILCAALAACVDDPEVSAVEQDIALYCPGVTTTGVTTYSGLSGTYVRLGLSTAGEPLRLTLIAEQDGYDARGTFTGLYTIESGLPAAYAGRFGALGDNPAIGAFFALDTTRDGEWDEAYFVLGITRYLGRVRALCLVGDEHPFQLSRTLY